MRILLSAMGSTGDIRPMIAISLAMIKKGHSVVILIPENGEKLCRKYQVPYKLMPLNYKQQVIRLKNKKSPIDRLKLINLNIKYQFEYEEKPIREFAPDLILGSGAQFATVHIAEALQIPYYDVFFSIYLHKSYNHPAPAGLNQLGRSKIYNRISWSIYEAGYNFLEQLKINPYRKKLGLHPIYNYFKRNYVKKNIIAVDYDLDPLSDNDSTNFQTDYWHLFENDKLDEKLNNFMDTSKPVIYYGFGSMPEINTDETIRMLERIINDHNIRIVLSKGWSDYDANCINNNDILITGFIPHHKLFPHLRGIIHHGGSGTTHTASWSGTPQIIIPHFVDQYYWAEIIYRHGLSPQPIDRRELTEKRLRNNIAKLIQDELIQQTAKKFGEKLQNRQSLEGIVDKIEDLI